MRQKGQLFDLKRFRDELRLSQKEIAEAVKRPQSFLSSIEHGRKSAPASFLDDLARIYEVENISDYIRDRADFGTANIEDVHNSIVNSSGGPIFVTGLNGVKPGDVLQILKAEDRKVDVLLKETESTAKQTTEDTSIIANLVKLLTAAEERNQEAEKRIKELEQQVADLQARLPKRKKIT